jgi:dihydrofolate reductase
VTRTDSRDHPAESCRGDRAAALDLIDEYRARIYPVLAGGGIPFFPQGERRVDLELAETRTFSSRVVHLRYRVAR